MKKAFERFLRDETGAVTVDFVVVWGGTMWMAMGLVSDIGYATVGVSDRISERLEYSTILSEILDDYGPGSEGGSSSGSGDDSGGGSDDGVDCVGNPGNDKCVGNSGEDPNGDGEWVSGSLGMSDSGN